jgi:hypothetical protein
VSRAAIVAIAALVLACGAPTLGFGFLAWDDGLHVSANPLVLRPASVGWRDQLLTPALGYPIPVTVASYRLDYSLFGLRPGVFHAVNVLLHLAACLLAFALARALGLQVAGASAAVLLFALHPASAEPVSWVSGRKDLLAAVFGLAALLLVARGRRGARGLSLLCYALALLSKPVIAPLAVCIALLPRADVGVSLDWKAEVRRRLALIWPYLLVLAPIALLGVLGQRAAGATDDAGLGAISRLRAVGYALGHHARLALLLEPPTVKYAPTPWPPPFPSSAELTALGLLAGLALALGWLRGAPRRVGCFGALLAGLGYLPSSSLLVPLTRYLADSYLYLPLLGLGLVLGALLDQARARAPRLGRLLAATPWLLGLTLAPAFLLSSARFADDLALWSPARARFPHHPRICREWSNAVVEQRGAEPGLSAIDRCIAEFGAALFVKNRGIVLARLGRFEEARVWLLRARERTPQDATISRYLAHLPSASPGAGREP